MITSLLSSLIGFVFSSVPKLLDIWQDKRDKAHELDMMDRQIQMQKDGLNEKLDAIAVQVQQQTDISAIAAETAALKEAYGAFKTNIKWVDAIQALVRPTIALGALYSYLHYKQVQLDYITFVLKDMPWSSIVSQMWGEFDEAIVSWVVGFYFGQRSFQRSK